jgi:predicted transposase YbfD/YdcC
LSCHAAFEIGVSWDVILSCLNGKVQLPLSSGSHAIVLSPCPTVNENIVQTHLGQVWQILSQWCRGQVKVNDKSNEITAIPELIKVLELSGCLVTIDAMGTQTQIVQLIQERGADYCLALKGNHKHLHEEVQQLFTQAEAQDWQGIEHSFHRTIEQGHGRTEIRRYWTMPTSEFLVGFDRWAGLQSIGLVESVRKVGQETTTSRRYYLNSFASNANLLAHAARSHWGVENRLHWILDVGFREDDCPVHSDHAPENLARLRKMSLNLLSQEKTAKIGVANKRLKAAWDNNYLAKVLGL